MNQSFFKARKMRQQLESIGGSEELAIEENEISLVDLAVLDSRLGRAGFLTEDSQKRFLWLLLTLWLASVALIFVLGTLHHVATGVLLATAGGWSYLSVLLVLLYLKGRASRFERELLFYLPLTLEQLLLLVRSGLGPVPAVREIVATTSKNPVLPFLHLVYQRAQQGEVFEDALTDVAEQCPFIPLKHFFLHLETSIALGTELSHALRQLSDHIHSEWHVTLEGMVRRLESAVVFPVFVAVIGLLLLVAAVPVVPLLELSENMSTQVQSSSASRPGNFGGGSRGR